MVGMFRNSEDRLFDRYIIFMVVQKQVNEVNCEQDLAFSSVYVVILKGKRYE